MGKKGSTRGRGRKRREKHKHKHNHKREARSGKREGGQRSRRKWTVDKSNEDRWCESNVLSDKKKIRSGMQCIMPFGLASECRLRGTRFSQGERDETHPFCADAWPQDPPPPLRLSEVPSLLSSCLRHPPKTAIAREENCSKATPPGRAVCRLPHSLRTSSFPEYFLTPGACSHWAVHGFCMTDGDAEGEGGAKAWPLPLPVTNVGASRW